MSGELWPDVEGGVRAYLRADAGVAALAGQRGYFGIPRQSATFPLWTVQRVGGGPIAGEEAPVDVALVQVDCWGRLGEQGGSKAEAWALATAVMGAFSAIRSRTVLTTGTSALDATVQALLWAPDPDTDQPRYTMTVEIVALAS